MSSKEEKLENILSEKGEFVAGVENPNLIECELPSKTIVKEGDICIKDMMVMDIKYIAGETPTKNYSGGGIMMTIPYKLPLVENRLKSDIKTLVENASGCKVDTFNCIDFYTYCDMIRVGENALEMEKSRDAVIMADYKKELVELKKKLEEAKKDAEFDEKMWKKRIITLRSTATKDALDEDDKDKDIVDMENELGECRKIEDDLLEKNNTLTKKCAKMKKLYEVALGEGADKKYINRDIRCGAFDVKTTYGYVVDMLDSMGYNEDLRKIEEGGLDDDAKYCGVAVDNTDEIVEECCGVIDWTINKYSEGATNGETLTTRIYEEVRDKCSELVSDGKMMELVSE
tara:strand:+ start:1685 stop:2716 length:1032 start_codon:yes stop_codon:yes gene_type:complete